jgi:hypothetical protein
MSEGAVSIGFVITDLRTAIDRLVEVEPSVLGDPAAIVDLHRELARLEAVVTRAAAAFDASKEWQMDGAQTAGQWLATRCHLPRGTGRRRVSLGRQLRHLPVCEAAWLRGHITGPHVGTIAAVRRPDTADALARDEELLVSHAEDLRFEAFVRVVAYWEQHADPDGADQREEARHRRRDVYLTESFAGLWLGKMTLDPISGAIVGGELQRREQELFELDWAEAKQRLGRDPIIVDLARTPGQRRADALVEMARRSLGAQPGDRRPAPLFSILVGYETVHGRICELAGGTVLAPRALLPWLEEAYLERAVFKPDRRVEVSETARLFTGATRRAIELRDRCCQHEYCDQPAGRCQADHIVPYNQGGPTRQDNGELLCGFHNRLKEKLSADGRRQRPPPGP